MSLFVNGASEMEALGARFAATLQGGEIIYLKGNLGAGKTTLVRGLLHGLGHEGKVKSPTYTLVENYSLKNKDIYHFDLYRLNDPEELEAMGIRDYCENQAVCLFEWPEQGTGLLPPADILISIKLSGEGRDVEITSQSARGDVILSQI